ncbi:MAG: hypothetical protein DCF19_01870 [Pseudanabaena frigida]|uniref:Uncharacterized protein n=1 Tax=Pseudanabaena frigida TaxID=945775 RepID=A0A2W4WJ59_9CYAN|nr:MAG: hypothetical protein DCF19_01870 [Pseudanabaena frigida]
MDSAHQSDLHAVKASDVSTKSSVDIETKWLENYLDWQDSDVQAIRNFPPVYQINIRQVEISKSAERKMQRCLSLTEIDSDIDIRWSKRFMPREFA